MTTSNTHTESVASKSANARPGPITVQPPAGMLTVSSSPHDRTRWTQTKIMWAVFAALIPNAIAATFFFGWRAPALMAMAVLTCIIAEFIWQKTMKRPVTALDGSAAVTGILLAMTLGVQTSFYAIIIGSVIAIIVAKQFFGGLGLNVWNPALVGRAFLQVAFPQMINGGFPIPKTLATDSGLVSKLAATAHASATAGVDMVSGATPLMIPKDPGLLMSVKQTLTGFDWNLLLGAHPSSLGESSVPALLLGGIILVVLKLIDWKVPVLFIGTTVLIMAVFPYASAGQLPNAQRALMPDVLYPALTGGLFLGAIFMATDMVTSPITTKGRMIFAVGAGTITALIRMYGGYPEGVCYAILIMNTTVPMIDRYVRPRVFGTRAVARGASASAS